jgi:hypothetical protein
MLMFKVRITTLTLVNRIVIGKTRNISVRGSANSASTRMCGGFIMILLFLVKLNV